jgi:hypothetical protein
MKRLRWIILMIFPILCSCSLFSADQFNIINPNAEEIARHNLEVLKLANINTQPYLIVDKNGKTSLKNLYLFINETQAPLARSEEVVRSLIKYNEAVLSTMNKRE